jgi:DNA-binding transcriptional ArsR family regulator
MRFSDIVIDDPNLSLAAKGVFSTLGLMGNSCAVAELASRTSDGERAVRAALSELERAGYVEVRDETVRVQSSGSFGVVL